MKKTRYADIAARYDENAVRHRIPKDAHLAAALARAGRPIDALDLACGTGNYLVVQREAFGDDVRWKGLDASPEMLAVARGKLAGVELVEGRAEQLPYPDASFDYVTTSFAFHHFEDKPKALDEIRRVCKPGARLRYTNVDPARMPGTWVFRFFPEAELEDRKRYWAPELVAYELEARGFTWTLHVDLDVARLALRSILEDAERRDVSELRVIDERAYERGLARLRAELARDPKATVPNEVAVARIEAELA